MIPPVPYRYSDELDDPQAMLERLAMEGGEMPAQPGPPQIAQAPGGDGGLQALRDYAMQKFKAPGQDVRRLQNARALSAAGAVLATPAANFWQALNGAVGAYATSKLNDEASDDLERLKYGQILEGLYKAKTTSQALNTRAAMPQFRWGAGVGLIKSDPMTGKSEVQIGDAQYAKLYQKLYSDVAKQFENSPDEMFPGGKAEKMRRIEEQTSQLVLRTLGQLSGGQPSGWTPETGAPPGSGIYGMPGVYGQQPLPPPPGVGVPRPMASVAPPEEMGSADGFGTPANILDAVRKVESNGDPLAVSPKGAMGPYQFMPATAADLHRKGVQFNPFDEAQSRRAADYYLSQLYKKYGNWDKALAAYNAGPGAVDSGRAAGFKETQEYVPKVQAAAGAAPVPTKPMATPGYGAEGVPSQSAQEAERKKSYGAETGKTGAETLDAAGKLYTNSSSMETQLNLLESLYRSNKNIAEGAGAEAWHGIKSWAATIGIDLGKSTGLEDTIIALTREMALKARTGTGENLLPGAISNYENQVLQSLVPSLGQTQQGRLLLIQFMRESARTNQRFGEEAIRYAEEHGSLDSGWVEHKRLLVKREKVRLAQVHQGILTKFSGSKKGGK